ncbi:MAG: ribonuclease P protein component [Kiritimatiellae bacterium]|nr:ribonuclease P protein component [Kiritimatiellia bacterium]MBR4522734.1 ribonuclease P protein component [Kiritimatiellia bacterium]
MSTRLPGRNYKEVFDRGRSAKGRLLVAWRQKGSEFEPQAGVVVSKRTFHDAVGRSRAKRLMREAFRLLVKEESALPSGRWIFIARASMGSAKCGEVKADMAKVCGRFS